MFAPVGAFDPNHQLHDFEPGIAPSGLAWTIRIPPSAIDVDPRRGRARLHGHRVPVTDYHDIFNALLGGGPQPLPSHVSFDVRWPGHGAKHKIRDEKFRFTGHYVTSPTTISFAAHNDHGEVLYTSNPHGQFNPGTDAGGAGSPAVGHERNGAFFR